MSTPLSTPRLDEESESTPRIVSITAGGAGMFCGSCMHDNTLAAALLRLGVDVTLVPTFTPTRTDEPNVSENSVFFGGINLYLDQRWSRYRSAPRWLRRRLDHPKLLRVLSKLALQTRGADDGALAVSLLRGEGDAHHARMLDLVNFITGTLRAHVVSVTNLLISGFVPILKQRGNVAVTVTLQGDDIFLDSLSECDRQQALAEMRRIARSVDAFITFSNDYRSRMATLFEIPRERITVVPLGLAAPETFRRPDAGPAASPSTLGYLARICPEKGFDRVVDAFLRLRRMPGTEEVRLRFGGWLGASDRPFYDAQLQRLCKEAGASSFDHVELPSRASKIQFLHTVDVLSVPSQYQEPKGLYVLEALAAGVPVVQPNHGSFPELLTRTGGGVLVPANDDAALTSAIHDLLLDAKRRHQLGQEGQRGVNDLHTDEHMAESTLSIWRDLLNSN